MSITTTEQIAIELLARTERLERELARAGSVVDRRLGGMESRGAAFASKFTGLLAGVGIGVLAQQFLSLADASKQMDAQLRLATATFGNFNQAQDDVARLAAVTRSGLAETTSLYGNMLRATQSLGGTQADAARAAETFSKALKIGGADANAAASATLQFGQALASGALRGDEFNSIAEASPRILKLLADSLGVPSGALRKMAEEGKLTADVLQRAFTDRKFTDAIDAEFQTLPKTFDQAMTQVTNAAITTFGAFDRGGEFSTALANFATQGADDFGSIAQAAEQAGIDIRGIFDGLGDVFDPMVTGAQGAFAQIGLDSRSLSAQIRGDISALLGSYDALRNLDIGAERGVRGAGNALVRGGVLRKDWFYTPESQMPQYSDAKGRFDRGDSKSTTDARRRLFTQRINDGNQALQRANRAPQAAAPRAAAVGGGPKKRASGGGGAGQSAEARERKAEAERVRALRDDQQFENEKAALNADLLRAKASIVTAAEAVAQFELQEIEAARKNANRNYQDTVDLESDPTKKAREQARANELIALNDKVAAERKNAVGLREEQRIRTDKVISLQNGLENEIDLANAQADLADTAKERRDAALRIFDLETRLERSKLEEALAQAQIAKDTARIADARANLAAFEERRPLEKGAAKRDSAGPLDRYRDGLKKTAGDMNDALEGVAVNGLQSVENGLLALIEGTESASNAFKKMAAGIIADLARIAIRKAIIGTVGKVLGFADGGEIEGFAGGGLIRGPGTGRSDSIVAAGGGRRGTIRVSNGEFIVNAASTAKYRPLVEAINADRVRGFADGGIVSSAMARPPIPSLDQMNATPSRSSQQPGIATVRLELSGDIDARMVKTAGSVAIEVVRASAPEIVQAASANTMESLGRMRL